MSRTGAIESDLELISILEAVLQLADNLCGDVIQVDGDVVVEVVVADVELLIGQLKLRKMHRRCQSEIYASPDDELGDDYKTMS